MAFLVAAAPELLALVSRGPQAGGGPRGLTFELVKPELFVNASDSDAVKDGSAAIGAALDLFNTMSNKGPYNTLQGLLGTSHLYTVVSGMNPANPPVGSVVTPAVTFKGEDIFFDLNVIDGVGKLCGTLLHEFEHVSASSPSNPNDASANPEACRDPNTGILDKVCQKKAMLNHTQRVLDGLELLCQLSASQGGTFPCGTLQSSINLGVRKVKAAKDLSDSDDDTDAGAKMAALTSFWLQLIDSCNCLPDDSTPPQ